MRTHDQQVQMSIQRLGAAVVAVLLSGLLGVVPEQAAPNAEDLDGIRISVITPITTREQLNAFLLSDAPKTITIDRQTGDLVSVTSGLPNMDLPTATTKF
jgi:hypothetical protein